MKVTLILFGRSLIFSHKDWLHVQSYSNKLVIIITNNACHGFSLSSLANQCVLYISYKHKPLISSVIFKERLTGSPLSLHIIQALQSMHCHALASDVIL